MNTDRLKRMLAKVLLVGGLTAGLGVPIVMASSLPTINIEMPTIRIDVKELPAVEREKVTIKIKNTDSDELIKIKDYDDLIRVMKEKELAMGPSVYENKMTQDMSHTEASTSSKYYSETNLQVIGVDEADTLKNDKQYIYQMLGNKKIVIIDTKNQLKPVGMIETQKEEGLNFEKMFLDHNQLIVIGKAERRAYKSFSTLHIYDISDKKTPKLIREVQVEGTLSEARKIDGTVYMLTRKYNPYRIDDVVKPEDILPLYQDSLTGSVQKTVLPERIWYQPWKNTKQYTIIAAIQLNTKEPVEVQAMLGEVDKVYMNKESLYFTSYKHDFLGVDEKTHITKYNVTAKNLSYAASGSVAGTALNQFSMDEYRDNFRIAVTKRSGNAVYVLDKRLKIIGELDNLAPGERIYSVRFIENKGYVVTFKQVDPLFVVDLTNPQAPNLLGELKIPGFSQYLHPIRDHLVVGIGRSTSERIRRDENGDETIIGMEESGIKLSLFDVSDPTRPTEVNHISLGTSGSYSGALENHKMVTVHNEKQLLAIPLSIHYDKTNDREDFQGAYVFGIEKGRLVGKAKLGKIGQYRQYSYYQSTDRVCYIGEKLYFLYDNKINEYELDTFSRVQTLQLD